MTMNANLTSFLLGAYWAARKESVGECADRLLRFFRDLGKCDESLSHWYERARSRKKALERPAIIDSHEYWVGKLNRGRNWTDINRTVIEDLGFMVGLWNGQDDRSSIGMLISCGSFSPYVGNSLTLHLPIKTGALKTSARMRKVLAAVATAWEPDWAGVMSDEAMQRRRFNARRPFVDWMLYVSDKWLPKTPAFEPPTTTERLAAGTIIVVQQEPPDPCNPTHLENIKRVRAALRRRVKIGT